MYKVLIIDDEPIIRKGLKTTIDWEELGCEVCGVSADGREGFEMVCSLEPDIIITDIKMPEMDGLEMLSEINRMGKHVKSIILTGYRDFEYAQEALNLGACMFLLKPTKIEDINAVVGRCVRELEISRNSSDIIKKLHTRYDQMLPQLKEKLLYDIMMGILTDSSRIDSQTRRLDLNIGEFMMAVVSPMVSDQQNDDFIRIGIVHTFEEILSDSFIISTVSLSEGRTAFIVQELKPSTLEAFCNRCLDLQRMLYEGFSVNISIGISQQGSGVADLYRCCRQCIDALTYRHIFGNDAIILYSDICGLENYNVDIQLQGIGYMLSEAIGNGLGGRVREYLAKLRSEIELRSPGDEKTITSLRKIISLMQPVQNQCDLDGDMPEDADAYALLGLIERLADCSLERISDDNHKSIRLIMKKAISYINENFQKQITLKELADHVHVSQYYISRMFSRDMGKTMTEFLNEVRINHAKELLANVYYKVYQVGSMVGIPDSHYFSRLFKKETGMTPSAYRDNIVNIKNL